MIIFLLLWYLGYEILLLLTWVSCWSSLICQVGCDTSFGDEVFANFYWSVLLLIFKYISSHQDSFLLFMFKETWKLLHDGGNLSMSAGTCSLSLIRMPSAVILATMFCTSCAWYDIYLSFIILKTEYSLKTYFSTPIFSSYRTSFLRLPTTLWSELSQSECHTVCHSRR